MFIDIEKPVEFHALREELYRVFPEWALSDQTPGLSPVEFYVTSEGTQIAVPDDADAEAVKAVIAAHDATAREVDLAWTIIRQERNQRLTACDWTQVADAPVDKVAWATYRQALRDVPATFPTPESVVWPTPPEE